MASHGSELGCRTIRRSEGKGICQNWVLSE
jgi:hypothetical protein